MKFKIGDRVQFKRTRQFGTVVDIRRNQHDRLLWCYILQMWRWNADGNVEQEGKTIDLSVDFVEDFYVSYFGNGVEEMLRLLDD